MLKSTQMIKQYIRQRKQIAQRAKATAPVTKDELTDLLKQITKESDDGLLERSRYYEKVQAFADIRDELETLIGEAQKLVQEMPQEAQTCLDAYTYRVFHYKSILNKLDFEGATPEILQLKNVIEEELKHFQTTAGVGAKSSEAWKRMITRYRDLYELFVKPLASS